MRHWNTLALLCALLIPPLLGACADGDDRGGGPANAAVDGGGGPADAAVDSATRGDAAAGDATRIDGDDADTDATVTDPAPGVGTPGEYGCEGCPETDEETFTLQLSGKTSHTFSGTVTGAHGDGQFFVAGSGGQELFGPIPTDRQTGNYAVEIPLFCGEQRVKFRWWNSWGSVVLVLRVTTTDCVDADLRLTLSWDELGNDWELHLIKPNGTINDQTTRSDCTWTTCISTSPDWGVQNDPSDDPTKDVDNTGSFGPENISLTRPEAGIYTVMVEHWGVGSPESDGSLVINIKGKPPLVIEKQDLPPRSVWTAARIEWPSGEVTPSQEVFDCSGSWSSGCTAKIP